MTFNRPHPLRRCLASLAAQTLPMDAFEVVLIDASAVPVNDVAAEFHNSLRLLHLRVPNRGCAGNRNQGMAAARADIVAFIDDDCRARPDWLSHLLATAVERPTALVGGSVQNAYPDNVFATTGQVIHDGVEAFYNGSGPEPTFYPGMNIAFHRRTGIAIGGFEESFGRFAAEDREFADRWLRTGHCLAACPDAVVWHEHRETLRGFARQYFNYGRGAWHYHALRRRRGHGGMSRDSRLHRRLFHYLGPSLRRLPVRRRWTVISLLGVWQGANLLGFLWQAYRDTVHPPTTPSKKVTVA